MVSASESAQARQGIAAELAEGLNTLSGNDEIVFTKYVRLVLPLDGYVFWVRAGAIPASLPPGSLPLNATGSAVGGATLAIKGSFHYSTDTNQNEAETEGLSQVVFTSQDPVQSLNDIQSDTLWIGSYAGDLRGFDSPLRFAFSSRGRYYQQADLYHYTGVAVVATLRNQLIDSPAQLSALQLVVSDSLPLWLNLRNYSTPQSDRFNNSLPLYPSFLVPNNLPPPYGVVHIEPTSTEGLTSAPLYDAALGQTQLCSESVRITLYGLTNEAALWFLSAVCQYSYDYNLFGLSNIPAIRDEKKVSSELGVLSMKKSVEFQITYNQSAARSVARQMVEGVINTYLPQKPLASGQASVTPH